MEGKKSSIQRLWNDKIKVVTEIFNNNMIYVMIQLNFRMICYFLRLSIVSSRNKAFVMATGSYLVPIPSLYEGIDQLQLNLKAVKFL